MQLDINELEKAEDTPISLPPEALENPVRRLHFGRAILLVSKIRLSIFSRKMSSRTTFGLVASKTHTFVLLQPSCWI
jgi:hypothetical protein